MSSVLNWLGETFMAVVVAVGAVFGGGDEGPATYQGYVEGKNVRIAAAISGTLDMLGVRRGDMVGPGDVVFILEHERESAALREAAAHLAEARFAYDNLRTGLRDPELEVIDAQRAQAEADLAFSESDLRRVQQLIKSNVAAAQRLDSAQAAVDRNKARVEELRARLEAGRMAARDNEIGAARARVNAAQAAVAQAEWQLSQRSGLSPTEGRVVDTLLRAGEQVMAGQPVIELLPPENLIVRFFVPEPVLSDIAVGAEVWLQWGAAARTVAATVTFIAPEAEFTPPVIYSETARDKLVFLVEARPKDLAGLNVGQPLDVTLEPPQ